MATRSNVAPATDPQAPHSSEELSAGGTDLTQLRRNRRLGPVQRIEKMLQIRRALAGIRGIASSRGR